MIKSKINRKNITLILAFMFSVLFLAGFSSLKMPKESSLKTFVFEGRSNHDGHFIIPHGLRIKGDAGQNYYRIYGILVSIQHRNGAWNAIDTSNKFNNTFFWNNERVEGWISRSDKVFGNRPVRIIIFAQEIVG